MKCKNSIDMNRKNHNLKLFNNYLNNFKNCKSLYDNTFPFL